jgi:hypothetical protein
MLDLHGHWSEKSADDYHMLQGLIVELHEDAVEVEVDCAPGFVHSGVAAGD